MDDTARLVEDLDSVVDAATKADFTFLERTILDRMDDGQLTMRDAYRILLRLRRNVFGGNGLCRITPDGRIVTADIARGATLRETLR
jgi:hypothetical protein